MNRLSATLLTTLAAVAALTVPVAAASATPAPDYGASVTCRYVITEPSSEIGWTEARLSRFVVSPPTVYAQHGTQDVGWRFIVKRSLDWDNGPWKVTYRSPIQRASATTSSAATFSNMKVGVSVPNVDNQAHVYYVLILKIFWYASNGSVQSSVSHEFDWYTEKVGRHAYDQYRGHGPCPGLVTQAT
jgi:hypothetical protein